MAEKKKVDNKGDRPADPEVEEASAVRMSELSAIEDGYMNDTGDAWDAALGKYVPVSEVWDIPSTRGSTVKADEGKRRRLHKPLNATA